MKEVAMCVCGHSSDCHAASDMGIHECADCACYSFRWNGSRVMPVQPPRDWITGKPVIRESAGER